jgi:hypothetical protein
MSIITSISTTQTTTIHLKQLGTEKANHCDDSPPNHSLSTLCNIDAIVLSLEIQLSTGGLDPIDRLNSATLLCLYKGQDLEIQRHTSWFFSVLSSLR